MLSVIFSWNTLWWIMQVLFVFCCLGLVGIVLLQKGKGGGLSGAFGMGSGAETMFGPRASRSMPARITQVLAAAFMILALTMSMVAGKVGKGVAPELVTTEQVAPELESLENLGVEILPEPGDVAPAGDAGDAAPEAEVVEIPEEPAAEETSDAAPEAEAEDGPAADEAPAAEEETPNPNGAN